MRPLIRGANCHIVQKVVHLNNLTTCATLIVYFLHDEVSLGYGGLKTNFDAPRRPRMAAIEE